MTSDNLEHAVDAIQGQVKQLVDICNRWATWCINCQKIIEEQDEKISYLESTLNSIIVKKNCITCYGFGLHRNDRNPMEQMDAIHGMPTVPCPECGANLNGK